MGETEEKPEVKPDIVTEWRGVRGEIRNYGGFTAELTLTVLSVQDDDGDGYHEEVMTFPTYYVEAVQRVLETVMRLQADR